MNIDRLNFLSDFEKVGIARIQNLGNEFKYTTFLFVLKIPFKF